MGYSTIEKERGGFDSCGTTAGGGWFASAVLCELPVECTADATKEATIVRSTTFEVSPPPTGADLNMCITQYLMGEVDTWNGCDCANPVAQAEATATLIVQFSDDHRKLDQFRRSTPVSGLCDCPGGSTPPPCPHWGKLANCVAYQTLQVTRVIKSEENGGAPFTMTVTTICGEYDSEDDELDVTQKTRVRIDECGCAVISYFGAGTPQITVQ